MFTAATGFLTVFYAGSNVAFGLSCCSVQSSIYIGTDGGPTDAMWH